MDLDFAPRFPSSFFFWPTLTVTRDLLGSLLVHRTADGVTAGRIVEAEAYLGPSDKGAHSFNGRMTERNRAMFGEKGHAYVFFVYGVYWCFNVTTGPLGKPQAVLIRALEPVEGIDLMRLRLSQPHAPAHTLCRGPGKLCLAMGIGKQQYGASLGGQTLFLVPGHPIAAKQIGRSPRIGIDYAEEYVTKPWRFYIRENACLSGPRRLNLA